MTLKILVLLSLLGGFPIAAPAMVAPLGCGVIREIPLNEAAKKMIAESEVLRTTMSQYLAGNASFADIQASIPVGTFVDFFIEGSRVSGVVTQINPPRNGDKGTLKVSGDQYSRYKGDIPIAKIDARSLSKSPAISKKDMQDSYKLLLEAKEKGKGVTFLNSWGHSKSKGRVVEVTPDGRLTLDEDSGGPIGTGFSNVHPSTIYITDITPGPLNAQETAVLQFLMARLGKNEKLNFLVASEYSEIAPTTGTVTDIRVGVDGEYRILLDSARDRRYYIRLSAIIADSLLPKENVNPVNTAEKVAELSRITGSTEYTVLFNPDIPGGVVGIPKVVNGFLKGLRPKTDGTFAMTIESSEGRVENYNITDIKDVKVFPVLAVQDREGFADMTAMINQAKSDGKGVEYTVSKPGVMRYTVRGFIEQLRVGADGRKYLVVVEDESGKKVFTRFDYIHKLNVLPKVER